MRTYISFLIEKQKSKGLTCSSKLIQEDSIGEHDLERLTTSHNFKPKMTPCAQNLFSLGHPRRLSKLCYKKDVFEQNVTYCCMLSLKQK